jgi:hypothetical protein
VGEHTRHLCPGRLSEELTRPRKQQAPHHVLSVVAMDARALPTGLLALGRPRYDCCYTRCVCNRLAKRADLMMHRQPRHASPPAMAKHKLCSPFPGPAALNTYLAAQQKRQPTDKPASLSNAAAAVACMCVHVATARLPHTTPARPLLAMDGKYTAPRRPRAPTAAHSASLLQRVAPIAAAQAPLHALNARPCQGAHQPCPPPPPAHTIPITR